MDIYTISKRLVPKVATKHEVIPYSTISGDITVIDITEESHELGKYFSCPQEWTLEVVKGIITPEEFNQRYYDLMRKNYKENKVMHWDWILAQKRIALACYCTPFTTCHRYSLVQILQSVGKFQDIDVIYQGEILVDIDKNLLLRTAGYHPEERVRLKTQLCEAEPGTEGVVVNVEPSQSFGQLVRVRLDDDREIHAWAFDLELAS